MRDALLEIHPERRRLSYRDGLMFALFAARAPRVRSMQSLRLGTSIRKDGDAYQLIFEKEDVKTSRSIEYRAPRRLTAAIDRYIAVKRAEMLGARHNDAFWVNKYGGTMTVVDIGNMIQRQSRKSLGVAFGPHRFRHCLGTTAPLADPSHPGVAASILGISGHMVEQHYNRANQADVANQFHASLEKDRAALETLARRQFQKCTKPKKPTEG